MPHNNIASKDKYQVDIYAKEETDLINGGTIPQVWLSVEVKHGFECFTTVDELDQFIEDLKRGRDVFITTMSRVISASEPAPNSV